MVLLQETKRSRIDGSGFRSLWPIDSVEFMEVGADGSAGGLLCVWNPLIFSLKECCCSRNFILSAEKIKRNIDGSRTVGFGGVFRDERGSWICGYYGKMDSGTSLETELWALYKGLKMLLQQGMHGVIIEFDAQQVVQLMGEDTTDKFPFKGLLEDAKIIFRGCECTIQHVFKEGNLCADALAKLGTAQPEEILVVKEPPFEIRSYLVADMVGLSSERA